ncbi:MAG: ribosome biogenesis GTP-binding protein YihA/YsxC [Bacteroidota bacterium]
MKISSAEFIKSSTEISQFPSKKLPEFGFIGRSNVGKSSLINMLLEKKSLAKTSQSPGRTRTINHFEINEEWYMVDLPGYGYAKFSKQERQKIMKFIKSYITESNELLNLFVLLDARIKPQQSDLKFMEWLGINQIPFAMVFTKIDKLSSSELSKNMANYRDEMLKTWEFLPKTFKTSAITKQGRDELLNYIQEILKSVKI